MPGTLIRWKLESRPMRKGMILVTIAYGCNFGSNADTDTDADADRLSPGYFD